MTTPTMNPLAAVSTVHLAQMLLNVISRHAGEFDPRLTPADLVTLCREIASGDVAPSCAHDRLAIQRALHYTTDQIQGRVYA